MITKEKLYKIINYLKNGTVSDLSDVTRAIALSEKSKITSYFSTVIDQASFLSQDYLRFRKFLIDWYAAHKTLTSLQSRLSDPRSLISTEQDELFRSFGYPFSSNINTYLSEPDVNKASFLLDLVNLYKKKGSPDTLQKAINYHGIPNIDIFELWLKYDANSDLIFEGKNLTEVEDSQTDFETIRLNYETPTLTDPHWFLTKSEIENYHALATINFPIKSPYIALVTHYRNPDLLISILSRKIHDQYAEYSLSGEIADQDAFIKILSTTVSFFELYLSFLYIFRKFYGVVGGIGNRFVCYDGTSESSIEIISEYEALTANPDTRAIREARLIQYQNQFSRLSSSNFFVDETTAEALLTIINSSVKSNLDAIFISQPDILLKTLVQDIARWTAQNVGTEHIGAIYSILGINEIFDDFGNAVNFFKPYRARWILLEYLNLSDRLRDSVRIEDYIGMEIDETIVDFTVSDSKPCCSGTDLTCFESGSWNSREHYDCGSFYDVGVASDDLDIYIFDGTAVVEFLLLEDGDYMLDENGELVIL